MSKNGENSGYVENRAFYFTLGHPFSRCAKK